MELEKLKTLTTDDLHTLQREIDQLLQIRKDEKRAHCMEQIQAAIITWLNECGPLTIEDEENIAIKIHNHNLEFNPIFGTITIYQ